MNRKHPSPSPSPSTSPSPTNPNNLIQPDFSPTTQVVMQEMPDSKQQENNSTTALMDDLSSSPTNFFIWETHITRTLARFERLEYENCRLQTEVTNLTNKVVEVQFKNHNLKQLVTEIQLRKYISKT
jgi:hypothetical protein